MRLIDADVINFNQAFGGNSEFAKDMRDAAQGLIDRQPTAFDKEKVIANLQDELKLAEIEKERCITESPSQFQSAKGYANGVSFGLEIVEKGGIE